MIRVIGAGPGDIKYLTFDAAEKIKSSSKILAFGRISKSVGEIRGDILKVDRVEDIIEAVQRDDDISILASGDPCFYGILQYLKVRGIQVGEVVPGISSFQYMMTRLKKSWHSAALVSLHGKSGGLETILKSRLCVVLTDRKNTPNTISRELYSMGVRGRIYAGFNLSYEDETIVAVNIGQKIEDISYLSVVVIENEMD